MAVTPRDASTVILARKTSDGAYEVLFTKRPDTMKFMGGQFVFPGGALDEADCGDDVAARSALSREDARGRLGEDVDPAVALGLHCAALRELFEEVGVLLTRTPDGAPVDPAKVREEYGPHQAELGHDAHTFAAFLEREDLTLATDLLVPHGRLVTPEMSPVRFDARFFVAPHPDGQDVIPDPVEVPEVRWMRPTDAMRATAQERLPIPIPTMAVLQGLIEVPGYEQLLRGEQRRVEVPITEVSPLVTHVLAPNPGLMTGPGTNTYIVGRDRIAIIDPAIPDAVYIERVARAAGDQGHPVLILLTHLHPDHIGGVAPLAEMGCPVGAWEGSVAEAPYITQPIADGDVIELGGATLRALHTPGHASHHLCFFLEEERAIFAGDVVAGLGTVVIGPPDGDMADYLDTLRRLKELDPRRIYPGHGPIVEDAVGKLDEYIAHRAEREAQVIDALEAGVTEIPAMVKHIYTDVVEALHPVAEMSVLAHLEMLEKHGRVDRDGDRWTLNEPTV